MDDAMDVAYGFWQRFLPKSDWCRVLDFLNSIDDIQHIISLECFECRQPKHPRRGQTTVFFRYRTKERGDLTFLGNVWVGEAIELDDFWGKEL